MSPRAGSGTRPEGDADQVPDVDLSDAGDIGIEMGSNNHGPAQAVPPFPAFSRCGVSPPMVTPPAFLPPDNYTSSIAGEPPPGRWARRRSSSPDKAVADVAAAAAFRTPAATPANMMVMEPGGGRFPCLTPRHSRWRPQRSVIDHPHEPAAGHIVRAGCQETRMGETCGRTATGSPLGVVSAQ